MRLPQIIICLLVGFLVAQCLFYFPNLLPQIATHFNASGKPNDWMTKESFMIFEAVILAVILAEFSLLPMLIEKMPDALINLPNKEYSISAERRHETFLVMKNYFEWLAVGLLGLFIGINQLIFKANISQTDLPSVTMWMILGAFMFFVMIWLIKFARQFKIKNL